LNSLLNRAGGRIPTFGELDDRAVRKEYSRGKRTTIPGVELDIHVTEEFELIKQLLEEDVSFLTVYGQAGTGKTTLIRWLREVVSENCIVLAPTGLAAITAGGQTIHSFFKLPPVAPHADLVARPRDEAVLENLELLIIDEISMVACDMVDLIDKILRHHRRKHRDKPFGGVQVVAVGDLYQLPPVIEAGELETRILRHYKSPFFFSAHALRGVAPVAVELTQPFRHPEREFLELLRSIRERTELGSALDRLNELCWQPGFEHPEWPVAVPMRRSAKAINEQRLQSLTGDPSRYEGHLTGSFLRQSRKGENRERLVDDGNLPSPVRLELKVGARVMFTRNDPNKRWVNGTLGTISQVKPHSVQVRMDDSSTSGEVEVNPVTWEKIRFGYDDQTGTIQPQVVGTFTQLPLVLAWAMTIHKLQGQTLDRLLVDLGGGAFASGQTYVAVSRCRSLSGLRLRNKLRKSDVQTDPVIHTFMTHVREAMANRLLDRN
jgi:hypothetical protein